MIICGIKLTHDASVALIDENRLIFSYEIEKINNNARHSVFNIDLNELIGLIEKNGYIFNKIDRVVFDGWHPEQHNNYNRNGLQLKLANYGSYITDEDVLSNEPFNVEKFDIVCNSYKHVSGHIFSSYCTSPFAKSCKSSYILVWDGGMFPQLFYYDYDKNEIKNIDNLFALTSMVYQEIAAELDPFNNSDSYNFYSLPGKVMAFSALGKVKTELISHFNKPLLSYNNKNTVLSIKEIEDLNFNYIKQINIPELSKKYKSSDIIATFQKFIGNIIYDNLIRICNSFEYEKNLCLSGGTALNIVWNSSLREQKYFNEIWIPPFPNDAGSALGVACCEMIKYTHYRALNWNVYSGPTISEGEISSKWEKYSCSIKKLAQILYSHGEPIIFLNGNAELGPRALGNRSILAPATNLSMKHLLNSLKEREYYRPVAPICLEEYAPLIFDPGIADPYMLFTHQVKDEWKMKIPAICHFDGSARLQTINQNENKIIYELLKEYMSLSQIPLLCNTSANFKGKGFFPDVQSAIQWGKINIIWSEEFIYVKKGYDKYLYDLI